MLYGSMDPNERFRARRSHNRRRKRRRRAAAFGVALVAVLAVGGGAKVVSGNPKPSEGPKGLETTFVSVAALPQPTGRPRPLPVEVRGVHVTGPLASIPGKLREYVGYKRYGLNTIELDVKDEGGEIGFRPASVPLAVRANAARSYFRPREVARLAHRNGLYLIGRVVVFQDPLLAGERPDLAVQRRDGSVWTTNGGLGWVNPYDRRVWDYSISIAEEVAKAGFDEIMLDYIRFPSDGDVAGAVYPGKTSVPRGRMLADFVAYAKRRLQPLGVRVSTALFGLSATRDMGHRAGPAAGSPSTSTTSRRWRTLALLQR